MNREEKYFAHLLFKLAILERNGQAYEDFFTEIMVSHNPNFTPVKPYGNIGDRKNDGFDKLTGSYYQVYAPEDISKKNNDALAKLEVDFKGLLDFWQNISVVKNYYFVLNDKYKGTFPNLEETLSNLEKEYSVNCNSFLNSHLENIFDSLDDSKKIQIVGYIPNSKSITSVDFSVLREVVNHLLGLKSTRIRESRPSNPDFIKKIEINGLTDNIANFLKVGNYQTGDVEEYFKTRGDFMKEELRQKFVELYNEGLSIFDDSAQKSDEVFFYIMEKAKPSDEMMFDTPVIVLMAYYFEYCDIFKVPD